LASLRDIAEGAIAAGQFASSTRLIASSRPLRSTSALTSERRARDYLAVWSNTLPARVERAGDTTVSIQGAFSTDDRGSNRKGVPALVRRRPTRFRVQARRLDPGRFRAVARKASALRESDSKTFAQWPEDEAQAKPTPRGQESASDSRRAARNVLAEQCHTETRNPRKQRCRVASGARPDHLDS
jgi:hypothetical protein